MTLSNTLSRIRLVPAALLMLAMSSASAMTVTPLLVEMQSTGRGASANLEVNNDSPAPLPVELTVEQISMDSKGEVSSTPAMDKWLVFPPQSIIAPGRQQSFRLQWLGDPALRKSESYHVVVKQVPVEMEAGQSGIQLVYNFRSLVNVAPTGGQPSIQVLNSRIVKNREGRSVVETQLNNPGNTHALLSNNDLRVRITSAAGQVVLDSTLPAGDVLQKMGVGLLQPGKQRAFVLPLDLPLGASAVSNHVEVSVKSHDGI